jgi:hypothetical protein
MRISEIIINEWRPSKHDCESPKRKSRSVYSSCVSQGYIAHQSKGKGHTDGQGNYLKGHKAKGKRYGGDVPDYS